MNQDKTINKQKKLHKNKKTNELFKKWLNNFVALMRFQYRRLFTTWTSAFIILGPFGLLVITAFVLPSDSLIYLLMGVGIMTTAFFQFGYTYREWKQNNSIKSNMSFSEHNIGIVLISFILFSIILSIIGTLVYLGLIYVWFYLLNIGGLKSMLSTPTGQFVGYKWDLVFYLTLISILLSISVAYFTESITSTSTSYTMFASVYIIIAIFGGGFMNISSSWFSDLANNSWIRWMQVFIPHWWINYFTLYFVTHDVETIHSMLKWIPGEFFHNWSLFMPWLYGTIIFTTAVIINLVRFDI